MKKVRIQKFLIVEFFDYRVKFSTIWLNLIVSLICSWVRLNKWFTKFSWKWNKYWPQTFQMKTFDKLASIIGISAVIVCLIAVYIMRGRTGTSQLASEIARKHQEDVYWLESDKSLVWYSVDVSKSNSDLRLKYVEMFEVSISFPATYYKFDNLLYIEKYWWDFF